MTARFFRQGFLCWLALGGALIANLTAAAEDKAAAEDEVVLHFPQDPAIGQLAARPAGAGTEEDPKWTIIGQAKGEVRVKKGTEILLQVADAEVLEVLADPDICHFGMTNVRGKVDPATLAQMQSVFLHTLVMSNLKLSDDELKHLQNLRTVRVLDLSMNPIVGPGLKYLSAMKDLEQLSIAYTQVDDDALEHLKGLQKLRKVDFSGSRISEKGYAYLGELPALEEVFIQSMDVGDEAMAGLAKSRSLKKITVANTQVTDKGFADLARIQTLGEVMVISDKMTNKGAADLAGAPHLKSLALICNGVTDDLSVSLKKMRSLKSLTLYCNSLTDKIFADIKEFKDLENFGINAAMISDDGVLSAGEFLAGLKGVGLGSEHITDASLPVFKGARKLEWLDMANTQVSIEGLQDLKKSLPEKCQIRYPMRMQGWKPPVSKAQIEKDSKIFPARTLHFPSDHSVGFVFVRAASSEDPIGHERSDAKGEVEVKGGYKATLNFYGQPEDVEIIFGLKSGDIQELSLGKEFKAYDRLPELKDLKLEKLSLSESRIRDEDVAAISKLDTLTQVSLYGCRVGDACLPYLRPLSRLKELHLSETRVTDSGVAQLAESKLETLWLDGTEITDASVEPLSKISTLKELWIGSTGITQEGADKLRKLLPKCKISYHPRETGPSHAFVTKRYEGASKAIKFPNKNVGFLKAFRGDSEICFWDSDAVGELQVPTGDDVYLELMLTERNRDFGFLRDLGPDKIQVLLAFGSGILDEDVQYMSGITGLAGLSFQECREISDKALESLDALTALEFINLQNTSVEGEGLKHLAGAEKLKDINLAGSKLTNEGLRILSELKCAPNLEKVSVSGTKITDDGLQYLARFTNAKSIGFMSAGIKGPGLAKLHGIVGVKVIDLRGTHIKGENLAYLVACDSIEEIWHDELDDNDLEILKNLKGLKKLGPLVMPGITDKGMASLGEFPVLESVSLAGAQITDTGLKGLSESRSLKAIQLQNTSITDGGLSVLTGMPALERLSISGTKITNEGLAHLRGCRSLTQIALGGAKVNDEGILGLKEMKQLKEIIVTDCPVSRDIQKRVKDEMPGCKVSFGGRIF